MRFQDLITPCYIINEDEYRKNISEFMNAYESCWTGEIVYGYSVKTNHLPYMAKIAHQMGWKMEVVSPDEYVFAQACGVSQSDIIYNGPQKRETVLNAITSGAMVNLDNIMEVEYVCQNASLIKKRDYHIGIRVNFDLEAECPGETTCKDVVGRFGICYENGDIKKAIDMLRAAGLKLAGLHMHASSTSRSLHVFEVLSKKAVHIICEYNLQDIKYIDIGGGFFGGNLFPGKPTVRQYSESICFELKRGLGEKRCEKLSLVLEPGAGILATSMDYLVSVLNIRTIRGERVITVDGSLIHINPMMNPHETPCTIINPGEETEVIQIIGGSTCMELDRFLPRGIHKMVEMNTQLLFHACGAYMSTHNSSFINAAPNIYIKKGNNYEFLRKKSIDSMIYY